MFPQYSLASDVYYVKKNPLRPVPCPKEGEVIMVIHYFCISPNFNPNQHPFQSHFFDFTLNYSRNMAFVDLDRTRANQKAHLILYRTQACTSYERKELKESKIRGIF